MIIMKNYVQAKKDKKKKIFVAHCPRYIYISIWLML